MIEFSLEHISVIGFLIGSPGMGELVVIAIVAVVLFGGKLPEVARSMGSTYQQFRKGLADIQSSVKNELDSTTNSINRIADYSDVNDDYDEPTAPKFDPPEEER